MQCRVLGSVELVAAGQQVPLTDAQRTIVAVLLVNPGAVVGTDGLIEAVWSDVAPSGARKAVHNHLTRLRRTLALVAEGDPRLVTTEGAGYRIDLRGHEHDASRFEALVAEARAQGDPHRGVRVLDAALGLWRGPAFGQLAAHDLVRAEAARLDELRAEVAAERIDALLRLGRHLEVVGDLEQMVATEPLRERPYAQLVLALYRAGRTAEALATFREIQRRLGEELGVDPAPELQELHRRILRQDPAMQDVQWVPFARRQGSLAGLAGPAAAAALETTEDVRGPGRALLGREADTIAVAKIVAAARLVTLTGPGGIGKTRLAEDVAGRFEGDVAVVELAPLREAHALDHAVASVLGVMAGGDLRDRIVSALAGRGVLLVMDNCEHLLPDVAELIEQLLRGCAGLTVLATSRERLAVDGEHLYAVPPLPVPAVEEATDPELMGDNPAVRLFCERAAAVYPGFALTEATAAAIVDICRRLDGVPLALELAAARVVAMGLTDLAARLRERLDLLAGGPRRERGRHRALTDVVAWSYGLLEASEGLLFDRLSVFAGGFTLQGAEQVCSGRGVGVDEIAPHLAALVDKSMVLRAEEGYRILEPLRVYGHARLAERGDAEEAHGAHARYFAGLVEQAGSAARGPDGASWLRLLRKELDNLRAAHRWAVDSCEADLALRLCAPLAEDGSWWLGDEIATWAEATAGLPDARRHALLPLAYGAAATGAVHRGELARSMQLAQLGLESAPDADDPRRVASLRALSLAAIFQGRFDDSARLEAEILSYAHATGDAYRAVFVHIARAMHAIYRPTRDLEAARIHAKHACADAETLGNPQAQAFAYYIHGEALADHDPEQALAWLKDSLELSRSIPLQLTEAMGLLALSGVLARRGEPKTAMDALQTAIRLWRHAGDWAHQWTTLRHLAFLLMRIGEDDTAATLIGVIDSSATAAPVYGADAERMRDARAQLRARLGPDRYEQLRRAGTRKTDEEAVAYALDQINAVQDGL